jgi:GR25 family glycosyltransferase involved in LPS biosynthesis
MIPVYWINLEESVDRRNTLFSQFLSQGITNRRVEAIKEDKPIIGCCKSHIKAIYTAWIEGNELAIICEDDVDFSNSATVFARIHNVLETLPTSVKSDWDVLQIEYTEPHFSKGIQNYIEHFKRQNNDSIDGLQNRIIKGYLYGAVAYLINRKGMQKFLNIMTKPNKEDLSKYTITATFDHPRAHSEELVYRYINSYMSVFPILNYSSNTSLINTSSHYYTVNEINRILVNQNRLSLLDKNYNIIEKNDVYILNYDLHWFNGGKEEVEKVINDIFE